MKADTLKQFVATAFFGIFSSLAGLITSYGLDHFMDTRTSTFFGLLVNYFSDFFIQEKIFTGVNTKSTEYMKKYIIAVFIAIGVTQLLFNFVHDYTKKYHKQYFDKKWRKHVTAVRWIVKGVVYTFLEFPLQKFWVFKS